MGLAIVFDVVEHKAESWKPMGFRFGNRHEKCLSASVYVHNFFAYAKSSFAAIEICRSFEQEIRNKWSLAIKASSREYMVCRGGGG